MLNHNLLAVLGGAVRREQAFYPQRQLEAVQEMAAIDPAATKENTSNGHESTDVVYARPALPQFGKVFLGNPKRGDAPSLPRRPRSGLCAAEMVFSSGAVRTEQTRANRQRKTGNKSG